MSQPVLEPRAGRCVGFGEWAAGGTQVTSVLAVPGVGFSVGPSNIHDMETPEYMILKQFQ